jgi:DNA-directed RNA polymerase subunit RPC12/RpoP
MEKHEMESYVNCPECGELVKVILRSYESEVMELAKGISKAFRLGIEESNRFVAEDIECKCGKQIVVSMTVTAFQKESSHGDS